MFTKIITFITEAFNSSDAQKISERKTLFSPQDMLPAWSNPNTVHLRITTEEFNPNDDRSLYYLNLPHASLKRHIFNNLPQDFRVEIFRAKLENLENSLNDILNKRYKLSVSQVSLCNVIDLSSRPGNSVFELHFKGKENLKLILKYCTPFGDTGSRSDDTASGIQKGLIENESFFSRYLTLSGIDTVMEVAKPTDRMTFLEYIEGVTSNKLFNKTELLPEYHPYYDSMLIQLSHIAAASDLIGKCDRSLNLLNNQSVFGNARINQDYKIFPIDNDALFTPSWDGLRDSNLRPDYRIGKSETAFLLTGKNLQRDKEIFRKEYLETVAIIRQNTGQIRQLIQEIYTDTAVIKRIEIFNNYVQKSDEEIMDWLDIILSDEALASSRQFIFDNN